MGRIIEGLWDCSYCDTKGNRGSIRECPHCGRPRDENTQFYMPESINYVSEKKEKEVNRKPDWVCPYCNSLNSDFINICESCGSARTAKNLDYFSIKREKSDYKDSIAIDSDNDNIIYENEDIIKEANDIHNFAKKYWKRIISITLILALIIGIGYLFIPKNDEITINSFEWDRTIEIEKYQTVNESGWSLPANARLQYKKTEFVRYESVFDHYETRTRQVEKQRISGYESYVSGYKDLGNGYFEEIIDQKPIYETYYETETYQEAIYREEPVYDTKYYYEIDKWLYERSIHTKGEGKSPYWGEVLLDDNERVSKKTEKYYINGVNSKGKEQNISLDYDEWINLDVNQEIKVKVSIFGESKLIE